MAIARLSGGPLEGQVVPLDDTGQESLIVPYGDGQLVYRREGDVEGAGEGDGPTRVRFRFVEATQEITADDD